LLAAPVIYAELPLPPPPPPLQIAIRQGRFLRNVAHKGKKYDRAVREDAKVGGRRKKQVKTKFITLRRQFRRKGKENNTTYYSHFCSEWEALSDLFFSILRLPILKYYSSPCVRWNISMGAQHFCGKFSLLKAKNSYSSHKELKIALWSGFSQLGIQQVSLVHSQKATIHHQDMQPTHTKIRLRVT
jgi:hypothetical protein